MPIAKVAPPHDGAALFYPYPFGRQSDRNYHLKKVILPIPGRGARKAKTGGSRNSKTMQHKDQFEWVIGLEVHAQLLTESKLFCGDGTAYGAEPNTQVSPVTLGHPGTLPLLNRKAIDYAIKAGLACHSEITELNYFARKNYFYPDLPKGYQISQHSTPICVGGYITINTAAGQRQIRLNRIHLEEDAGKSVHDIDPENTCVDFNRAGVPLIEIVSEPDLHSGEEAYAYLTELRRLLRYLGICDGNMEEGSMRCDANISIRPAGTAQLGTKVEVKNLNSIRNVKRAIEAEARRQIELALAGEPILQQTRSFDAGNGSSFALRSKEEANDYRYFPDPDITPFHVTESMLQNIRSSMPELPEARSQRFRTQFQLSEYDAALLTDERDFAEYYEQLVQHTVHYKAGANWMLGPLRSWMNEENCTILAVPVKPASLAKLIAAVEAGRLSFSTASSRLFPMLLQQPEHDPLELAKKANLLQESDEGLVSAWVNEVLERMPEKVQEYRKGKKGLIGLFVGEVKKISKGKADPRLTNDILLKKLQS